MRLFFRNLLLLLSSLSFGQNTPYFSLLKISECTQKSIFSKQMMSLNHYSQGSLHLKFGFVMCCTGIDTFKITGVGDTLSLASAWSKSKWVKHAACDCFYTLDMMINNLPAKPKVYRIDGSIYTNNKGFISYSNYLRNKNKTYQNNSSNITSTDILPSKILGRKWDNPDWKNLYQKLGNDSLMSFSYDGHLEDISYLEDGVWIEVSDSGMVQAVSFANDYRGQFPRDLKLMHSKKEVDKIIGPPDKFDPIYDRRLDKNGEELEKIIGYTAYHYKEKLTLKYNLREFLESIEITSRFEQ